MKWRGNHEDWQNREDYQAPPDPAGAPAADMIQQAAATADMLRTPLGEPPANFDVRCTFASRIVNGFDFNFSQLQATLTSAGGGSVPVSAAFVWSVPPGYRIVPLEWDVQLDPPFKAGLMATSYGSLTYQNAVVPYNQNFIIGNGTPQRIKSFYICEEQTLFGLVMSSALIASASQINVNVYGNLIPVTDVALPLSVANNNCKPKCGP